MHTAWNTITEHITKTTGTPFTLRTQQAIGGGSINTAFMLEGADARYFVKLNSATRLAMFEAEAEGLRELTQARTVRVPEPVCCGVTDSQAYLVMEHIALGSGTTHTAEVLGQQLAALHRITRAFHGWEHDNTIGSTPQINTPSSDWVAFWDRQRLGYQLELAAQQGYGGRLQQQGERLRAHLPQLLADHAPAPSLLHGDLWSGNAAADAKGAPVIFDPAVYYGDRETDIAMTELFGGFSTRFYQAYDEAYPLPTDYPLRKTLYNLYHVLNHLNLFGGGYLAQAEQMLDRLLSEIIP